MVTKPKSNSVITHQVTRNGAGYAVGIQFDVLNAGTFVLNVETLSARVREQAMIHGMIQRISDAAAISRNPETGQPATPEEKFAAMKALADHYESGTDEWRRTGTGGGERTSILFRALVNLYPAKTPEDIREWIKSKSKTELAALRNSSKVRAEIDRISPKAGDADEMLAELEG